MLVTLKVQSAFNKFFDQPTYTVDIHRYADILSYIRAMQPKFTKYLVEQELTEEYNEGYVLLNNNLEVITNEDLFMIKAKEGDILYLVPAIVGGGGKRGGIFAIFAIFALVLLAPMLIGAAQTFAAGAGAGGFGTFGSIFRGFMSLPSIIRSMVTSVALSVVTRAFQKQPTPGAAGPSASEAVRENGAFGPLTNSTTSGTPVALHYGMPRVSGQFLSGYIDATSHGKNDIIKVGDKF